MRVMMSWAVRYRRLDDVTRNFTRVSVWGVNLRGREFGLEVEAAPGPYWTIRSLGSLVAPLLRLQP